MEYHTAMTKCKALRRDIESHGRGTRRKQALVTVKVRAAAPPTEERGLGLGTWDGVVSRVPTV